MTKQARVVASIEARMGSSRLPGKVLMDVNGRPALSRLLDRLRAVSSLDDVVLATTDAKTDDALAAWAAENRVKCYRGSEEDVLNRVVEAQHLAGGTVVVEVTGDCTLLCPDVIELGIATYFANDCDIVSNCGRVQTFPMGADVQVFSLALLEEVERTVRDPAVREHVSLYFYENPDRYRLINLVAPPQWQIPGCRLQLDYREDHSFISQVYAALEPSEGPVFGLDKIAALLRRRPELLEINRYCEEKAPR